MSNSGTRPYSKFKIVRNYLSYFFQAQTKHGVHSPTVYQFIENVLDKTHKSKNKNIEKERSRMVNSKQIIDFVDYGKNGNIFKKSISEIAKSSLKSKKYATILSQIVKHYKAQNVLELGTSLGITTAYLAQNKGVKVDTFEGDPNVINVAKSAWNQLGMTNISVTIGNFDNTLDEIQSKTYDVIYLDGNHKLNPTLRYFNQLKKNASKTTVFVFDDIHYSKEMEEAWKQIKASHEVTITMDLFFLGIVFIDPTLSKQNFLIRY